MPITALVLGLRQLQVLQSLELAAYDRLVQSRPDLPPDPRLLVVAITEEDFRRQGGFPISSQVLADVLQRLQTYQPRAMGLDILRDVPVPARDGQSRQAEYQALLSQLKSSDRMIVITKLPSQDQAGVPPPPGIPNAQLSFNDVVFGCRECGSPQPDVDALRQSRRLFVFLLPCAWPCATLKMRALKMKRAPMIRIY